MFPDARLSLLVLVGAGVVALGIVGDLFESLLKRSAGVKDSSALIPGPRRRARSHRQLAVRRPVFYVFVRYLADLMKRLAILGSTGSIGQSALAVVDAHPDRLRVVALAAGENVARFAEQVARYAPDDDRDGDRRGARRRCERELRRRAAPRAVRSRQPGARA